MAVFTLAIATTKTAYDAYLTANATIRTAQTAIAVAGAQTTKPNVSTADADWNSYVTANEAWIATNITLQANLQAAIANTRVTELAVIATLGYNTGDVTDSICSDAWVKVVGAGGGILTYTDYIGYAATSIYLTITHALPAHAFPNTATT